jgi:uncharacterized protein YPO0396
MQEMLSFSQSSRSATLPPHDMWFKQTNKERKVMNEILERQIALENAEIAKLKLERDKAVGEAKAKLQAQIDAVASKLKAQRDQLVEKIATAKREGEAQIKSLQQQVATATGEAKAKLEKRIAEARADEKARIEELNQAWQHVKKAVAV